MQGCAVRCPAAEDERRRRYRGGGGACALRCCWSTSGLFFRALPQRLFLSLARLATGPLPGTPLLRPWLRSPCACQPGHWHLCSACSACLLFSPRSSLVSRILISPDRHQPHRGILRPFTQTRSSIRGAPAQLLPGQTSENNSKRASADSESVHEFDTVEDDVDEQVGEMVCWCCACCRSSAVYAMAPHCPWPFCDHDKRQALTLVFFFFSPFPSPSHPPLPSPFSSPIRTRRRRPTTSAC